MALWFFQRTRPGEIKRIPLPSMQRFLVGESNLPDDGDGFVRCIGVSVELHRRKPSMVGRVWFSKIRVDAEGRIDPHHKPQLMQLAREGGRASAEGAIIPAHHRFAERRLSHLVEWRPEQVDVDALRAAVNHRAKKGLL
jgi:hypothetical protein